MRNQNIIFILLLAGMPASLSAQEVPNAQAHAPIQQIMGERDKGKEDQIAKLFEKARRDLKLPRLGRIEYREVLEARVCTMALTSAIPSGDSHFYVYGFYKTTRAESIAQELQKVASYNDRTPTWHNGTYNPKFERYSIAVWVVKDPETSQTTYWVGAYLYWNAGLEFFMNHFTCDWDFRNEWKKEIAPECFAKR